MKIIRGDKVIGIIIILFFFVAGSSAQSWEELNDLLSQNYKEGNLELAAEYGEKAISQCIKEFGKEHAKYGETLDRLALVYKNMGQYNKALPLYQDAIENCEIVFGKESSMYASRLSSLGMCYESMNKYDDAISLYQQAIAIFRNTAGEQNKYFHFNLNILAGVYEKTGQFEKALSLYKEALQNIKEVFGTEHYIYRVGLNNIAQTYRHMCIYDAAMQYFEEALLNCERNVGKNNFEYISRLNYVGVLYDETANFEKAVSVYKEVLNIFEKNFGKEDERYAIYLNNLAMLYRRLGQYEKALTMVEESLVIVENTSGKESPLYDKYLYSLGLIYKNLEQYNKALNYLTQALEYSKANNKKDHYSTIRYLNGIVRLHMVTGHYEEALPLCLEVKEKAEQYIGKDSPDYGFILHNLDVIYRAMSQYEKALSFSKEALEIYEKSLGKTHYLYSMRLNDLAILYWLMGRKDESYKMFMESKTNLYNELKGFFTILSKKEREGYFANQVTANFDLYKSFYIDYYSIDHSVAGEFYNDELVQKGVLLQSALSTQKVINSSGDSILIKDYLKLQSLKNILDKQIELPVYQRSMNIDSMKWIVEGMESDIAGKASHLPGFKGFFNADLSWKDIQKELKSDEAAIEFSSINYYNSYTTDSTLYYALVLRKNDKFPLLVPLCEEKVLTGLMDKKGLPNNIDYVSQLYASRGAKVNHSNQLRKSISDSLYSLIWSPIDDLLDGINTVYYTPSGLLHTVAFSALSYSDSLYLGDKYNLITLSSTRHILKNKESQAAKVTSAVLYGGIYYDVDTTLWKKEVGDNVVSSSWQSQNILPEKERGGMLWFYLPGTLKEVDAIGELMKVKNTNVSIYKAYTATEESYKRLCGNNSPDVIHIATHGFYFPLEVKEPRNEFDVEQEEAKNFNIMEDPLRRSGILLTGANNGWNNENVPKNFEDGILTAWEVSNNWLGNTKLVVLSACETGLGEIKGGEGVFGLQRAFKLAGSEYVMMSLWQVPDKETAEFMELFYSNWLGGKEIREAFNVAQNTLRAKYSPYFWAAFVLMK